MDDFLDSSSGSGNNTTSFANYGFWRWEYLRRNKDYRSWMDDNVIPFVAKYDALRDEGINEISSFAIKALAFAKESNCTDKIDPENLVLGWRCLMLAGQCRTLFKSGIRDYNDGFSGEVLLLHALKGESSNEFFREKSRYTMPDLQTELSEEGDKFVLKFSKDINPDRLAAEAEYQLVTYTHSHLDDEHFFSLICKIKSLGEEALPKKMRSSGDLSRAVGLWMFDYCAENSATKPAAIRMFLNDKSKNVMILTGKVSFEEERWIRKLLNNAFECVETMKVVPLP